MKKVKKEKNDGRKVASVQVPSWDPTILNRDLLKGFAGPRQGVDGWAYGLIQEFCMNSFPMGHNPLETLRKILPQWKWSVTEVTDLANEISPWEGEIGHPAYSAYCAYCGNGKGPKGSYGEEELLAQWAYSAHADGRTFWVQATRPVSGLGFVAKTESGSWHFVPYRTEVLRDGAEQNGWNFQPYPPSERADALKGKEERFAPFRGFIPHGTIPVPVEPVGEPRDWWEGDGFPYEQGSWGKSGFEQDYVLPDGKVMTKSVMTGEWP